MASRDFESTRYLAPTVYEVADVEAKYCDRVVRGPRAGPRVEKRSASRKRRAAILTDSPGRAELVREKDAAQAKKKQKSGKGCVRSQFTRLLTE